MASNKVQDGNIITVTGPTGGVATGGAVDLATRIAIALVSIAESAAGAASVEGVFELAAETGVAWAQGDALYYDFTAGELTKTPTNNTLAGYAWEAKGSSAAVGKVKLQG